VSASQLNSKTYSGASGPTLLISAGVHGDECEPMLAVRSLFPVLESAKLHGTVILVPVVNAAAFERGARTAEDGLDLARVCPGTLDGSITQRTAHFLSELIRAADFYIDLHTGGAALALIPLAGYLLHSDPAILEAQRRMARAFNLPFIWGTTPTLNGRSLSVARDAAVPAIYVEYGGGAGFSTAAIADLTTGCLNVMAELKMLDRPMPPRRKQEIVEESSPESGHLQINYPSPLNGIFEPAATLGRCIEPGEAIGRVTDPNSGASASVRAEKTGLLVMLRALPRVQVGDALAAIVPRQSPASGGTNA
jgi:predicted deacylase